VIFEPVDGAPGYRLTDSYTAGYLAVCARVTVAHEIGAAAVLDCSVTLAAGRETIGARISRN
jgi:hypothetical protein